MTPFQKIVALAASVSPEEKRKLKLLFGGLAGGSLIGKSQPGPVVPIRRTAQPDDFKDDWLFFGIKHELSRRGLNYLIKSEADVRKIALNYPEQSEIARSSLEACYRLRVAQPRREEFNALGSAAARALAAHIEHRTRVSLKVMLLNAGNVLEAVDEAFPGYMRCGMIASIVRR